MSLVVTCMRLNPDRARVSWPCASSGIVKELPNCDAEGFGHLLDIDEADVPAPSLNPADVAAVQAALVREDLLAPSSRLP